MAEIALHPNFGVISFKKFSFLYDIMWEIHPGQKARSGPYNLNPGQIYSKQGVEMAVMNVQTRSITRKGDEGICTGSRNKGMFIMIMIYV